MDLRSKLYHERKEGRREGRAEGLSEGLKKGREEREIELIQSLRKKGKSPEEIVNLLDLSIGQVMKTLNEPLKT